MTGTTRRDVTAALAAGLAAAPGLARAAQAADVAVTRHGPVRGRRDGGVLSFLGVRYGADTGAARFQPPRPPQPWTEVRDAFSYGPACPQGRTAERQSEDCLFLNVWTPALRDGRRRPVLVYIHGGAYSSGSGSHPTYDGSRLVRRGGAVVVTLNHRLNAFGYAYLDRLAPGFADSGNAGQLDLVQALRWVHNNIAEFGGDPGCVTVFGQSGGGAKIATLMATPDAAGLFHRALTMSGQQLTASGPLHATERARTWLDAMGLKPSEATRAATLPTATLVKALSARDPILGFGGLYFGPVQDDRSLPRHPFYPDAPPQSARLPMIIGNAHDETRAFLGGDPHNFALSWDELPAKLTPEMRVDIRPEKVVATYRRLYPAYSPSDVFFAATTASRSWRAAVVEAELRAAQDAPTWAYQLNWRTPVDGGKRGAYHTLDIPLMFDTVVAGRAQTGGGADAQAMADEMSETLLHFARTGSPERPGRPWPQYRLPNRTTRIFDLPPRNEDDPRGAERRLFATVPFIQAGT